MAEHDERRSWERFPTKIEVDYGSGDTFLFSYIENISEMGIFIRTDDPMQVGETLSMSFGHGGNVFELMGEVAWINPVRPDSINPGMGVRFIDLTPEQRERVVELVRTIAYLQPGESN